MADIVAYGHSDGEEHEQDSDKLRQTVIHKDEYQTCKNDQ